MGKKKIVPFHSIENLVPGFVTSIYYFFKLFLRPLRIIFFSILFTVHSSVNISVHINPNLADSIRTTLRCMSPCTNCIQNKSQCGKCGI